MGSGSGQERRGRDEPAPWLSGEELLARVRRTPPGTGRHMLERALFEVLFQATARRISRRFRALPWQDIEELVADGIHELMRAPDRYNPDRGTLAGYLEMIVDRDARTRVRHQSRLAEIVSLDDGTGMGIEDRQAVEVSGAVDANGAGAETEERVRLLDQALRRLPPMTREVVRLHSRGLAHREIARHVDRNERAVRANLSRGLARLRRDIGIQ
jgi:RNA polymerase sigma factor (sigma-70 family)